MQNPRLKIPKKYEKKEKENLKEGYERSGEPDTLIPQIWRESLEILFQKRT